jgi:lysophospholipase L1-like esterase
MPPRLRHAGLRTVGLRIAGAPLVALLVPLYLHASPSPTLAGYSGPYLALLLVATGGAAATAWWIGRRCERAGHLRPAFAFLAVVGTTFATLALAELGLRASPLDDTFADLARFGHERSPLLGFEARANHRWELDGARFSTDERRFRTRPAGPIAWDEPGTRIAVVGGSSAFGFGLDDDETWPHRLEVSLREQGHEVEVANAANQGHNSFQTLVRTYLRVLPLGPDWVVLYESRNDAGSQPLPPTGAFLPEQAVPWTTTGYLSVRYPDHGPYLRTLVVYLSYRALRARLPQLGGSGSSGSSGSSDWYPLRAAPVVPLPARDVILANAESYIRNVRTLLDTCRRRDARLVLVTFLFDTDRARGPLSHALLLHNELLRELARSEGVALIDLEREFGSVADKRSYFFEDAYHPSERGAAYIAARIASHFGRLLGEHAAP